MIPAPRIPWRSCTVDPVVHQRLRRAVPKSCGQWIETMRLMPVTSGPALDARPRREVRAGCWRASPDSDGRTGTRGGRVIVQHLDDEPHFGGDAQHRQTPPDAVTREERAIRRLDRQERDDPVERELAVQEAETEDEPAPARAAAA